MEPAGRRGGPKKAVALSKLQMLDYGSPLAELSEIDDHTTGVCNLRGGIGELEPGSRAEPREHVFQSWVGCWDQSDKGGSHMPYRSMPSNMSSAIRTLAQGTIKANLLRSRDEADQQLRQIGDAIARKCGCKVLFGPPKEEASANRKLKSDYSQGVVPEGDWHEMKDLVRLTLLGRNPAHTVAIANEVRRYCGVGTSEIIGGRGLSLMKNEETKSGSNPCAYSGYNFVVRLRNGVPGEIQVNIPEVLYGKGPREEFCNAAGLKEWNMIRSRFQIESSLGHGLYEIWRKDKAGLNGKFAAILSKQYYDYLRGIPNIQVARPLQGELTAFKTKNKNAVDDKGKLLFHWDEQILLTQVAASGKFGMKPTR